MTSNRPCQLSPRHPHRQDLVGLHLLAAPRSARRGRVRIPVAAVDCGPAWRGGNR